MIFFLFYYYKLYMSIIVMICVRNEILAYSTLYTYETECNYIYLFIDLVI